MASTDDISDHVEAADALAAPEHDIATMINGTRMYVQFKPVPESQPRRRLQKILIWKPQYNRQSDPAATRRSYNPEVHGPKDTAMTANVRIHPTAEEVEEANDVQVQYLVVGMLRADRPDAYKYQHTGRKGQLETEQKQKEVLDREAQMWRVCVRITEKIPNATVKFYVACGESHGVCSAVLVQTQQVFFFEEFWKTPEAIDFKLKLSDRQGVILSNIKWHAATIKEQEPQRMLPPLSQEELEAMYPLNVQRTSHLAALLALAYPEDGKFTKSTILALGNILEQEAPDLCFGPQTSDFGVEKFHKFNNEFRLSDAHRVAAELKKARPDMDDLKPEIILEAREGLARSKSGQVLRYGAMAFFLEYYQMRRTGNESEELPGKLIESALAASKIHDKHCTTWTPSKPEHLSSQMASARIGAIAEVLDDVLLSIDRTGEAVMGQFGPLMPRRSLKTLMAEAGHNLDASSHGLFIQQISAVISWQVSNEWSKQKEKLKKLREIIIQHAVT